MATETHPNSLHGNTTYTDLQPSDWVGFWKEEKTGFHKDEAHPMLVKHVDKLTNGKSSISVLFPLCGKALGMKFLYDAGHTVIGIEVAKQAIHEFSAEQNIELTEKPIDGVEGSVFTSSDGRLKIYNCDLFQFSSKLENNIDALWDRGALSAINKGDRQRYLDLLLSVLSKDFRYLLAIANYDSSKYAGPPHPFSESDAQEMYGKVCNVQLIDKSDELTEHLRKMLGLDEYFESAYIISPK